MNWLVSWWPRGNEQTIRPSLVTTSKSANKLDHSPLQELCFVHAVCTSSSSKQSDAKEIQQKTIQLREEWRQVISAWATQAFRNPPKNEPELVTWTRALNEMCHDPSQTEKGDALQMLKPECRGVLTSPALNALLLACIWERHMFLLNQQPLREECFWVRDPATQMAQLRAVRDEKGAKEYRGVFATHKKSYEIWLDVYFVYLDYIIARLHGLSQEQKQILIERRIELFQRIHDREINASHHQAVVNDTPSTDPDGAGVSAGTAEALHEAAADTGDVF